MFKLIKIIDATRVASLFYLGPPVTMLMAWAVFGDTLQLMDVAGLVIVCVGVILALLQFEENKGDAH
jgi:drug/metabolite transporter (DMT)-like permease